MPPPSRAEPELDHYAVLGVAPDATADELRRAYLAAARDTHPDHRRQDPDAVRRFQRVEGAYSALRDPETRRAYDARRSLRGHAAAPIKADSGSALALLTPLGAETSAGISDNAGGRDDAASPPIASRGRAIRRAPASAGRHVASAGRVVGEVVAVALLIALVVHLARDHGERSDTTPSASSGRVTHAVEPRYGFDVVPEFHALGRNAIAAPAPGVAVTSVNPDRMFVHVTVQAPLSEFGAVRTACMRVRRDRPEVTTREMTVGAVQVAYDPVVSGTEGPTDSLPVPAASAPTTPTSLTFPVVVGGRYSLDLGCRNHAVRVGAARLPFHGEGSFVGRDGRLTAIVYETRRDRGTTSVLFAALSPGGATRNEDLGPPDTSCAFRDGDRDSPLSPDRVALVADVIGAHQSVFIGWMSFPTHEPLQWSYACSFTPVTL